MGHIKLDFADASRWTRDNWYELGEVLANI
jgi:hypothetical protein